MTRDSGKEPPKLEYSLDEAAWKWLKPHALRDVVILVAEGTDLLEVGRALIANDSAKVEAWIVAGVLSKPTREQLDAWDLEPERQFLSAVVQPWVLMQVFRAH